MSAQPNVCVRGCVLSTIGSCISLIGTSIIESYKLMQKQNGVK